VLVRVRALSLPSLIFLQKYRRFLPTRVWFAFGPCIMARTRTAQLRARLAYNRLHCATSPLSWSHRWKAALRSTHRATSRSDDEHQQSKQQRFSVTRSASAKAAHGSCRAVLRSRSQRSASPLLVDVSSVAGPLPCSTWWKQLQHEHDRLQLAAAIAAQRLWEAEVLAKQPTPAADTLASHTQPTRGLPTSPGQAAPRSIQSQPVKNQLRRKKQVRTRAACMQPASSLQQFHAITPPASVPDPVPQSPEQRPSVQMPHTSQIGNSAPSLLLFLRTHLHPQLLPFEAEAEWNATRLLDHVLLQLPSPLRPCLSDAQLSLSYGGRRLLSSTPGTCGAVLGLQSECTLQLHVHAPHSLASGLQGGSSHGTSGGGGSANPGADVPASVDSGSQEGKSAPILCAACPLPAHKGKCEDVLRDLLRGRAKTSIQASNAEQLLQLLGIFDRVDKEAAQAKTKKKEEKQQQQAAAAAAAATAAASSAITRLEIARKAACEQVARKLASVQDNHVFIKFLSPQDVAVLDSSRTNSSSSSSSSSSSPSSVLRVGDDCSAWKYFFDKTQYIQAVCGRYNAISKTLEKEEKDEHKEDSYEIHRALTVCITALWERVLPDILREAWKLVTDKLTPEEFKTRWNEAAHTSGYSSYAKRLKVFEDHYLDLEAKKSASSAVAGDQKQLATEAVKHAQQRHLDRVLEMLSQPTMHPVGHLESGFSHAVSTLFDLRWDGGPNDPAAELKQLQDKCQLKCGNDSPGHLQRNNCPVAAGDAKKNHDQLLKDYLQLKLNEEMRRKRRSDAWKTQQLDLQARVQLGQEEAARLSNAHVSVTELYGITQSKADPALKAWKQECADNFADWQAAKSKLDEERKQVETALSSFGAVLLPSLSEESLLLARPDAPVQHKFPFDWECIMKGGDRATLVLDNDRIIHEAIRLVYGVRCTFAHGDHTATLSGALKGTRPALKKLLLECSDNRARQVLEWLLDVHRFITVTGGDYTVRHNEWLNWLALLERVAYLCVNQVRRVVYETFRIDIWPKHSISAVSGPTVNRARIRRDTAAGTSSNNSRADRASSWRSGAAATAAAAAAAAAPAASNSSLSWRSPPLSSLGRQRSHSE